jgi:hypothetical protein
VIPTVHVIVTVLLLAGAGATAAASPEDEPRAVGSPTADAPGAAGPLSPSADADKDIFDVLRELLGRPLPSTTFDYRRVMLAVAPVISYNPANGAGVGVAGNVAFYRGDPDSTRISSLVASATATTKGQVLVNAKIDASAAHNRWTFTGDDRLYWTSQTTYGLGTRSTQQQAVGMEFDYFKVHEIVYRQVRRNLSLGAGFLYGIHKNVGPDESSSAEWEGSPYVSYSERYGYDPSSQTSAGVSLHALLDSRDSAINASRGVFANLGYQMYFEGFLGGTSSWQQLSYDVRTYVRLSPDARHRVAFWTFGNLVTGGAAPYMDLPATGWDTYGRSGRGYGQGRFRGERMLYGEAEYRFTITRNGLFGVVAFVNTETLSNAQTGERLFDSFATGAGFGLRLSINKRSKTNLCVDFGWGEQGEHGVYLAVQEAF